VALQANTTLRQLDLGDNELGCGKAMVEALKANTTLTQLSLNGNKLGDAIGCALAMALQTNSTLTHLNVVGNHFDDSSVASLESLTSSKLSVFLGELCEECGGQEFRQYHPLEDGAVSDRCRHKNCSFEIVWDSMLPYNDRESPVRLTHPCSCGNSGGCL
jgi:hypothetical protein